MRRKPGLQARKRLRLFLSIARPAEPQHGESTARQLPHCNRAVGWLGAVAALSFAGSTNAIVAFESLPDINTGVVMAIFCLASFAPVMKRNRRVKLPSSALPLAAIGVSATESVG